MKNFRRVIQSLSCPQATILFALFTGLFFVRNALTPMMGDDYGYAFIWDGEHGGNLDAMQFGAADIENRERVESFSDIAQSMWSHYFTWGGRILSHTIVQFFVWIGKPYFDIANTIIFAALVLTTLHLADGLKKFSRAAIVWIFFCLFVLTKFSVVSMICLTGACNYMWAATFQLLFLLPHVKALRSNSSKGNVPLMILLGLIAGWSNEAGALVTICLTGFLVGLSKSRGLLRSWMTAGLSAAIVGCALMIFAPGNFVRLELIHPDFNYTTEIFFAHLSNSFLPIICADFMALLPMIAYFLRRAHVRLNTSEILMIAFAATGLLVPTIMLFSPEFALYLSLSSMIFAVVASTCAIAELEPRLPIVKPIAATLTMILLIYFATLIYSDLSLFKESRRQIQQIESRRELGVIELPPLNLRHRFDVIHSDASVAPYLKFFANIDDKPNVSLNALVARYYGVQYVIGRED